MGQRKRHTREQIIRKLQKADVMLSVGKTLDQVCQALEVSEKTYLRWRKDFGENEESKRLKELCEENERLKQLLVQAELDKAILKEALTEKH